MNLKKLKTQLIEHEGMRLKPYRCPAGKLTIGCGRNLEEKGISETEANFMLENDIWESIEAVRRVIPDLGFLGDARQHALIDMCFNLGSSGFGRFKRMIAAVNAGDFDRAADEMVKSQWYEQVGNRAVRLVEMMREG